MTGGSTYIHRFVRLYLPHQAQYFRAEPFGLLSPGGLGFVYCVVERVCLTLDYTHSIMQYTGVFELSRLEGISVLHRLEIRGESQEDILNPRRFAVRALR